MNNLLCLRSQHPIIKPVVDLLYPPTCLCCGENQARNLSTNLGPQYLYSNRVNSEMHYRKLWEYLKSCLLCQACGRLLDEYEIRYLRENYCQQCGRMVESTGEAMCIRCQNHSPHKNIRIRSLYQYKNTARIVIKKVKYEESLEAANLLALRAFMSVNDLFLDNKHRESQSSPFYDLLLLVPSQNENVLRRGFYSTGYIARILTKLLKIRPASGIELVPVSGYGSPRSFLSLKERLALSIPEFELRKGKGHHRTLYRKRILLIDDVLTTGASVRGAIENLNRHEPELIDILTLCQSSRFHRLYLADKLKR